jgi:protein gp37
MPATSNIQWCDKSWNPITGCTKISAGCAHCYAKAVTERFPKSFPNGFTVTLHEDRLSVPLSWKKPSKIFVNSMSDLFHEEVPLSFIQEVFKIIAACPQHIFQILTKRSKRLVALSSQLTWHPNIWMGVSVENQKVVSRVDDLREIPAAVRFLSCEPLIGPLELNLQGIDWVIVGGESGADNRPIRVEWVKSIRDQCLADNVSFFFKQWGGFTPKAGGRILDGRTWDEFPLVGLVERLSA